MKWSIPQHRFGTLNSKSIHGSSNLTVGTLQETLEVFCLNVMPRHLLQHNQETPRLTIMIPWPGGSSRQSRSSPAPCPCSRWCFAHKLACGKAEASREGSSQKTMLGGREKKASSYNKHALIFWHGKRRALKMKPRISFSKKEADIRFWNLPWSFHQGNPPMATRAWRLPIDIFGDLVFPSSWVPAWSFLAVAAEVLSKMTRKLISAKMSENVLPVNLFAAFRIWACPKTRATSRMVSLPTRTATNKDWCCVFPIFGPYSNDYSRLPIMGRLISPNELGM